MIILEVGRHGTTVKWEHQNIKEAVEDALSQLKHDQSFPQKITEDGKIVWEFKDMDTFRDQLEKLIST